MVGHEQGSRSGTSAAGNVLALSSITVGLGALKQLVLAGSNVLLLASPGTQDGGLQGTTVREGEGPWADQGNVVDGTQVDGGLLLGLTSRQEGHASNGGGNGAAQSLHGGQSDLLWGVLLGRLTGGDHVGLQQSTLQVDVVVAQGLVDGGQDGLGDLLGAVQI